MNEIDDVMADAKPRQRQALQAEHRDAVAEGIQLINDSGTLAQWGFDAMDNAFKTHKSNPEPQLEILKRQLQNWWGSHSIPAFKFKAFRDRLSKVAGEQHGAQASHRMDQLLDSLHPAKFARGPSAMDPLSAVIQRPSRRVKPAFEFNIARLADWRK